MAKYLDKTDGLSPTIRSTILQHLTRRLQQSTATIHQKHTNYLSRTTSSSSPQLLTSPPSAGATLGFAIQTPSFVSGSVNSTSTSVASHPIHLLPVKLATGETVFVLANPNDLLLRHQMLQMLNEQPNTGGEGGDRRHTNEEETTFNQMQSVDCGREKDGVVSYEAISPPAEPPVSPLQLSRQNNHHTDALKPLSSSFSSSSSTSSIDIYAKLQTTKYLPLLAKGDFATNANLVFNNSASELAIESKFPVWLLSECSSAVDCLSFRLPQGVVAEAQVVDHCQVSDDQSHVWRPW